ncbi:MAG: DsrE family protein [Proteobacteria bacterium]|nr:DsrE family protein [Pseudomonadota bacterium]
MEKENKVIYFVTHAGEDPERAILPFVMATAGLTMGIRALVVLQGNGVYLARKGYADHVFAANLAPLKDLMEGFIEAGGRFLVCVPCLKARKIEETDLVEGCELTAAAALNAEIITASASMVY